METQQGQTRRTRKPACVRIKPGLKITESGERERERERQTDRQTDRERERDREREQEPP